MNQPIGMKGYFLDEIEDRHDHNVLTPAQLREEQAKADAARQRHVNEVMQPDYETAAGRLTEEVQFAHRIVPEGKAALDEDVLTPLRRGQITAKDAAKRVQEMRRDLNAAREALLKAAKAEESKWAEVGGVSAAEHQRNLAKRAPQLYQGGRGLLSLPVYDR